MDQQIYISYIFPCYERPEDVQETISKIRLNSQLPYEIWILDNSAKPHSYQLRDNEHYIFTGENLGTAARNIGIYNATGEICVLLDDDSHPLTGSDIHLKRQFEKAKANTIGFTAFIQNPCGNHEATLLPTVFHGAGFAFKRKEFTEAKLAYPEEFRFYGEEYLLSMQIYSKGYRIEYQEGFKVCHRKSPIKRNKGKIFYHLARNNKAIFDSIVPEKYRTTAKNDSLKRYELISQKEKVYDSYLKGLNDEISALQEPAMSEQDFEAFSLIEETKNLTLYAKNAVLCGVGKFPSLWINALKGAGFENVYLSDFNTGLQNQKITETKVLTPEEAINLDDVQFIGFHCSVSEKRKWQHFLNEYKSFAV